MGKNFPIYGYIGLFLIFVGFVASLFKYKIYGTLLLGGRGGLFAVGLLLFANAINFNSKKSFFNLIKKGGGMHQCYFRIVCF